MPLLPDRLLRTLEGLLSVLFLGATLLLLLVFSQWQWGTPGEVFGVRVTPERAIFAMVVFLSATLWFGFGAIRGGSTPSAERRGKPPVIDPE